MGGMELDVGGMHVDEGRRDDTLCILERIVDSGGGDVRICILNQYKSSSEGNEAGEGDKMRERQKTIAAERELKEISILMYNNSGTFPHAFQ